MRAERGERLSLPVLLSFNELAWIIVFALALLLAAAVGREKQARAEGEALATRVAQLGERSRGLRVTGAVPGEPLVRRELVGLKGDFRRVAFLVDRSASMARERGWAEVREIVRQWVQHLAVEQAVLITFDDRAEAFPADGLLDLSGSDAERNRAALVSHLDALTPGWNTDTEAALAEALRRPGIDTIVLFTDGAPSSNGSFDQAQARRIFQRLQAERQRGRSVPVNAVGLGDYFEPQSGEFLRRLTRETGGAFLGR